MTRFLYLVDAIPADDEPGVTADVPAGVSWCGNTDGTSYVVVTDVEIDRFLLAEVAPEDDPAWQAGETYAVGDRRTYGGIVYRCIQAHTSQPGWEPPAVPALWAVARSDGDPWVQPTMAEDAYSIGRIVVHDDALWSSKIDANTTTPGSDDRWWVQVANLTERAQQLVNNGAAFALDDPAMWSVGGV